MTRRTSYARLAALFLAVLALATIPAVQSNAQSLQTCLRYTVYVDPNTPACVFPIQLITDWGQPIPLTHTATLGLPNQVLYSVTPPNPPGAFSAQFNWVKLAVNGVAVSGPLTMGTTTRVTYKCFMFDVTVTASGACLHIEFNPKGPACPAAPNCPCNLCPPPQP